PGRINSINVTKVFFMLFPLNMDVYFDNNAIQQNEYSLRGITWAIICILLILFLTGTSLGGNSAE
ncbi:hypothetical protein, partial [Yersinia pestis]